MQLRMRRRHRLLLLMAPRPEQQGAVPVEEIPGSRMETHTESGSSGWEHWLEFEIVVGDVQGGHV